MRSIDVFWFQLLYMSRFSHHYRRFTSTRTHESYELNIKALFSSHTREITVRVQALRTCAHSQARMHTPAQPGLWVEVAEGIVLIGEGGAEHCNSPRRKPQQLEEHAVATCTASPRSRLPHIDRISRRGCWGAYNEGVGTRAAHPPLHLITRT